MVNSKSAVTLLSLFHVLVSTQIHRFHFVPTSKLEGRLRPHWKHRDICWQEIRDCELHVEDLARWWKFFHQLQYHFPDRRRAGTTAIESVMQERRERWQIFIDTFEDSHQHLQTSQRNKIDDFASSFHGKLLKVCWLQCILLLSQEPSVSSQPFADLGHFSATDAGREKVQSSRKLSHTLLRDSSTWECEPRYGDGSCVWTSPISTRFLCFFRDASPTPMFLTQNMLQKNVLANLLCNKFIPSRLYGKQLLVSNLEVVDLGSSLHLH